MMTTKKVHFNGMVKVHAIRHVADISEEETRIEWFSTNELQAHRKRDRKLVSRALEQGIEEMKLSVQGLETPQRKNRRRKNIRSAQLCVLLEQEQQWDSGSDDPERIAKLYSESVAPHILAARERAVLYFQESSSFFEPSIRARCEFSSSASGSLGNGSSRDKSNLTVSAQKRFLNDLFFDNRATPIRNQ